jgi:hypothetical protein
MFLICIGCSTGGKCKFHPTKKSRISLGRVRLLHITINKRYTLKRDIIIVSFYLLASIQIPIQSTLLHHGENVGART